jgi:hypothetical protein
MRNFGWIVGTILSTTTIRPLHSRYKHVHRRKQRPPAARWTENAISEYLPTGDGLSYISPLEGAVAMCDGIPKPPGVEPPVVSMGGHVCSPKEKMCRQDIAMGVNPGPPYYALGGSVDGSIA